MKKLRLKRWISFGLSVALVVGCIYISEPMETEAATLSKFDEITADFNPGTDIIAGDVLVSEDFSGYEAGSELVVNSTWNDENGDVYLQNYAGDWMWEKGSNTVAVKEISGEKYLGVSDNNGTTAIIFPSTGKQNYVVTANVYLDNLAGTIGLITNIIDPVENSGKSESTAVTESLLEMSSSTCEIKNRYSSGDITQTKQRFTIEQTFEQYNIVEFTACVYKGYTYFYINAEYMGKIANKGNLETNTLCGFYACGSTVSLKDVTISKLVRDTSNDIRSKVEVLENLVDEDFSVVDETTGLPYGWKLIKGTEKEQWLWNTQEETKQPNVSEATGGIKFSASASDGALLLPTLGTSDYVMTANIICESDGNYMGLLSDVNYNEDVNVTTGSATKSYIYMKNHNTDSDKIKQENRNNGNTDNTQIISTTEILANKPGNKTPLKLTIYSFKGYTYFYIGDVFVKAIQQYSPELQTGRCGFYVCASAMTIQNVKIDAIGKKGDISRDVYATETLVEEDFANVEVGALPDKWEILQDKWIMVKENVGHADIVEVDTDSTKKYLNMYDDDGAVGLILPALGTSDYVLTANIVPTTDKGTVGLMTNIKEPLSKAEGATHSILSLKGADDKVEQFWRKGTGNYEYRSDLASTSIGKLLGNGDSIKLTVYSYQGYSYFYVNDMFVCYTAHKNAELETSMCGLYICGTSIKVNSVSVKKIEAKGETNAVQMIGAAVRYADADGVARTTSTGMRFVASVDKDSFLYNAKENVELGMIIGSASDLAVGDNITLDTNGVVDFPLDEIVNEDSQTLQFATTIMGMTDLDEYYAARAYIKVEGEYYYSNQIKRSQARLATRLAADENISDESVIAKLETVFGNTEDFAKPDEVKTLDFTVLADLHYMQGKYSASIADLTTILDRAKANNSSFVMHMGDFCNDYKGSVELTNTYMASEIPTYGIYGNHELESANNSMDYVTPLLTNQPDEVTWGTADGNIDERGAIGYYYFEKEGFRIVCTDSNYSWNEAKQEWQHNTMNSWGSPEGNTKPNSLGDVQLAWLEDVLMDAAESSIPCVVLSHATMSGSWEPSPDSDAVQAIFRRVNTIKKGTVLLALNGHNHQDHMKIVDDVVYIDINTVRNGFWDSNGQAHYTDDQTFEFVKYDTDGKVISTEMAPLNSLSSSAATWFFEEPLSANIRISTAGYIHVDGWETDWMYDVDPGLTEGQARTPWISDYKIDFLY